MGPEECRRDRGVEALELMQIRLVKCIDAHHPQVLAFLNGMLDYVDTTFKVEVRFTISSTSHPWHVNCFREPCTILRYTVVAKLAYGSSRGRI